jgi:RimJ/RimL family protein N-acetyltransferase
MSTSAIFIETERLCLRPFSDADLHPFTAMRRDPATALYQSWSDYSEADAYLFLLEMQNAQPGKPGEWYQFAVALRDTDQFIGDCALYTKLDGRSGEIGYTFAPAYQKQGYATEALTALLYFAQHTLQLDYLNAITDSRNTASIALLKRLHFQRQKEEKTWFKGEWTTEYHYHLNFSRTSEDVESSEA